MIINFNAEDTNEGEVTFFWESTLENPTYYLYKNGLFIGTQTQSDYTIVNIQENEVYRFEVFDAQPNSSDIEHFFPGNFYFNFYTKPSENILSYKVESNVNDAGWTTIQILNTKTDKSVYSFQTPWYEDTDNVQIRIYPKYRNNKESIPFYFNKEVITYPSPVSNSIALVAGSLEIDLIGSVDLEDSLIISVVDPLT